MNPLHRTENKLLFSAAHHPDKYMGGYLTSCSLPSSSSFFFSENPWISSAYTTFTNTCSSRIRTCSYSSYTPFIPRLTFFLLLTSFVFITKPGFTSMYIYQPPIAKCESPGCCVGPSSHQIIYHVPLPESLSSRPPHDLVPREQRLEICPPH